MESGPGHCGQVNVGRNTGKGKYMVHSTLLCKTVEGLRAFSALHPENRGMGGAEQGG